MNYRYIIAGAGLGGLSFIHHLILNGLDEEVLVLDLDSKNKNDRTWSFWATEKPPYECIKNRWDQLSFMAGDIHLKQKLAPYAYYTVNGIDFYNEVFKEIKNHPKIHFLQKEITAITDREGYIEVKTSDETYCGEILIDSISRPPIDSNRFIVNHQNFLGWTIKTDSPYFDAETPTLMDFRVPQREAASFVYTLPYSETHALVEYTQFASKRSIPEEDYRLELKAYLNRIGVDNYSIEAEEIGSIPMTNFPFEQASSPRIHKIGTVGGDTKPTTGYTFMNVQARCEAIIKGQELATDKIRFKHYDHLLLEIIKQNPQQVEVIMSQLFSKQPIPRVLKFLDEKTDLLEETMIFGQLPWLPFLTQLKSLGSHVLRN